jgi:hypothetical protein
LSMCPALNLSGQTTYLSDGARAQKPPLPDGVASLTGECRGGVGDLCPEMSSIVDDVAEGFAVTTALSQVAVLSNPPPHVIGS